MAGDLEKLGGAFDTLMIAMGTSSQDPLRELVQLLTGVVDVAADVIGFFTDLPGPVQATLGTIAGLAVLNGPLSGVLDTLKGFGGLGGAMGAFSEALGYAKANGDGLFTVLGSVGEVAGGKMMGGLTKVVGYIGGPWGAAIAGGVLGLGSLIGYLTTVGDASVDTAGATDRMTDAYKQSAGAIDDNVRAMAAQEAADQDLRYGNLLEYADKAGVSLPLVTEAILGNEDALRQVTDAFDAYAEAEGQAAIARGEDAGGIVQLSIDANEASDAVSQLAGASGEGRSEAALLAAASGEVGTAMEGAADSTALATEEVETYSDQLSAAKERIDEMVASLAILNGDTLTALEAERQWADSLMGAQTALDGLDGSVVDSNGNLNLYTEAGNTAASTLQGLREDADNLIGTMIAQGETTDAVTAKDNELRQSFYETALQMTDSEEAALNLTNQIFGIPEERTTQINASTDTAAGRIAGIAASLFGLPDGFVDVNANTGPAEAALANFMSTRRIVTIGTRTVTSRVGSTYQDAGPGLATGGPVWGAGSGTSDSINARLSNGEFVVNAIDTAHNRSLLEAINSGQVRGFAAGGRVNLGGINLPTALDTSGLSSGVDAVQLALEAAAQAVPTSGPAGSGSIGGTWTSIYNAVKGAIPAARQNSTYRPGDPGYHGRNKAVDFGYGSGPGGAGSAGLASINRFLYDNYGSKLAELIYDGIGDDRPDIKNGRPHTYNAGTRAQHANHVHAANYALGGLVGTPSNPHIRDSGGPLLPGFTYNGTGRNEMVVPASSREFSGGSSIAGGVGATSVNITGAEITGTLQMGGDGLMRIVDGRIVAAVTDLGRGMAGRLG